MKPCPFCGKKINLEDHDTFYPTGIGWKDIGGGFRSYHSVEEVPSEQWCYKIVCAVTSGGCDAEISGDSKNDVIQKWNRRV